MDINQKIPALTQEYLGANIPYYSKVWFVEHIAILIAAFLGTVLIFVAEYSPKLFPFPQIVLDLSCNVSSMCQITVEQMLGYGFDHRALLMRQANAIGATLFLLGSLASIPCLPAYYTYCEAMYRLTRRRKMQLVQNQESSNRQEKAIIRGNSIAVLLIATALIIVAMLSVGLYWEGKTLKAGAFDVFRYTAAIAIQAIGMYVMLYLALMYMFRTCVCFRSMSLGTNN